MFGSKGIAILAYNEKPIDHTRAIIHIHRLITDIQTGTQTGNDSYLDLWPWPSPWLLTQTLKQGNSDVKTRFFAFDLDLWLTTFDFLSQPSQGQGETPCQISRSKVKWTDWRTLQSTLSPSFAVNKKLEMGHKYYYSFPKKYPFFKPSTQNWGDQVESRTNSMAGMVHPLPLI